MVVDLRVVDFEDLGEINLGSIDEHEVAIAVDGEAVGYGFVGAHFSGVYLAGDSEGAHGSVEPFGCGGERLDVDVDAIGAQVLLDGLSGIEEGVVEEVPDGTGALTLSLDEGKHVEVERLDGEFATFLGKEGTAAYFCYHVATTVDGLLILLHAAVFGEVFAPEALVAGQFVNLVLLE